MYIYLIYKFYSLSDAVCLKTKHDLDETCGPYRNLLSRRYIFHHLAVKVYKHQCYHHIYLSEGVKVMEREVDGSFPAFSPIRPGCL